MVQERVMDVKDCGCPQGRRECGFLWVRVREWDGRMEVYKRRVKIIVVIAVRNALEG